MKIKYNGNVEEFVVKIQELLNNDLSSERYYRRIPIEDMTYSDTEYFVSRHIINGINDVNDVVEIDDEKTATARKKPLFQKAFDVNLYPVYVNGELRLYISGSLGAVSVKEADTLVAEREAALAAEERERKAFGRRASALAKKAGVPWDIAKMAAHHEFKYALKVLENIKYNIAYYRTDEEWDESHELLMCGIGRRSAALERVLFSSFKDLNCRSQRATTELADFVEYGKFEYNFED